MTNIRGRSNNAGHWYYTHTTCGTSAKSGFLPLNEPKIYDTCKYVKADAHMDVEALHDELNQDDGLLKI